MLTKEEFFQKIRPVPGILNEDQPYNLFLGSQMAEGLHVELGCLAGLSSICIELGMREADVLVSIDLFDTSCFDGDLPKEIIGMPVDSDFFSVWRANIDKYAINPQRIIGLKGDRLSFMDKITTLGNPSFLLIDAEHTYKAVSEELETFVPLMEPGSIIAFHDYHDICFPGVKKAIEEYLAMGKLEKVIDGYLLVTRLV